MLGPFCHLIALIVDSNSVKGLRVTKFVKKISLKGSGASYNQKKVSRDNNSQNI